MRPQVRTLPCGARLHLQHGPIDLIIGAEGPARKAAFTAAVTRFDTVLAELMAEIEILRAPIDPVSRLPAGAIARRMDAAARPHSTRYVTPMIAVAGAVADTILTAMLATGPLQRAYVNNGGDIALHLEPGQHITTAIQRHDGQEIGRIRVEATQAVGGIATSGRHGRSLSRGISDSVTVLAASAAGADAAATLIANAVDLPDHPDVRRMPANSLDPDSDLGDRTVVTGCGPLAPGEVTAALSAGLREADAMRKSGNIRAAALHLRGQTRLLGAPFDTHRRRLAHA